MLMCFWKKIIEIFVLLISQALFSQASWSFAVEASGLIEIDGLHRSRTRKQGFSRNTTHHRSVNRSNVSLSVAKISHSRG